MLPRSSIQFGEPAVFIFFSQFPKLIDLLVMLGFLHWVAYNRAFAVVKRLASYYFICIAPSLCYPLGVLS